MGAPRGNAIDAVTAFLQGLPGASWRRVAEGEWGLVIGDVEGRPLEVGLRFEGGLLRAQAWCAPAGAVACEALLHRNRLEALVRYGCSRAGDIHVHGDVPEASACDPAVLDRLLVGLVEAAAFARSSAPGPIESA